MCHLNRREKTARKAVKDLSWLDEWPPVFSDLEKQYPDKDSNVGLGSLFLQLSGASLNLDGKTCILIFGI